MQRQGPGSPQRGDPPRATAGAEPLVSDCDKPLTTAQRTALERLIVKIMALSNSKAPEIWAALHHQLNIESDDQFTSRYFQSAEQLLQARLDQAQLTRASRQLMQQLTDLLPKGNNRQAVSDFIRREFGHTVLSQLSGDQLLKVVELLQNGQLDIPQPQQGAISDRTLLPAEHHTLSQQISRLAAITGESPVDIWQGLMNMMGLKDGDPIPVRHYPLLMQFLHAHIALSQQPSPTLATVQAALKQPASSDEQQAIEAYCQQHFNAINSVLSPAQVSAVMQFLFIYRLARTQSQHRTTDARLLQPAMSPLIATEQGSAPMRGGKKRWGWALALLGMLVLIWLLAEVRP